MTRVTQNTTAPKIAADDRQFGPTPVVTAIYGIKKGTLYNLERQGLVDSRLIYATGSKRGIRLWDLGSVRRLFARGNQGRLSRRHGTARKNTANKQTNAVAETKEQAI